MSKPSAWKGLWRHPRRLRWDTFSCVARRVLRHLLSTFTLPDGAFLAISPPSTPTHRPCRPTPHGCPSSFSTSCNHSWCCHRRYDGFRCWSDAPRPAERYIRTPTRHTARDDRRHAFVLPGSPPVATTTGAARQERENRLRRWSDLPFGRAGSCGGEKDAARR